jgi:phosphatidylglycerophosphatase A
MVTRRSFQWICLAISSTFGFGFIGSLVRKPGKGGGTAGAFVALMVQLLCLNRSFALFVGLTIVTFVVGWIACRPAEELMLERWGPRARHTGEQVRGDFNETCIDEVHGQFLAALPLWIWPRPWPYHRIFWLLLAFLIFRICDGSKPPPVSTIEQRFKGTSFGIMIDDTVAALFPFALLVCVHYMTSRN